MVKRIQLLIRKMLSQRTFLKTLFTTCLLKRPMCLLDPQSRYSTALKSDQLISLLKIPET